MDKNKVMACRMTHEPTLNEGETLPFFCDVREGFKFVAEHADHVKIDYDKIKAYAAEIKNDPAPDAFDADHHFISGELELDYGYVLLLDAVNFGSGYQQALVEEGLSDIAKGGFYFHMAKSLKETFLARPIMPRAASTISAADVTRIFAFPPQGQKSQELAQLFAEALQDMGQAVLSGGETYAEYVESMNGSVEGCVELLAQQPKFQDRCIYKQRNIGFYKRAQITAADLYLTAQHNKFELFHDIEKLTLFADNAVPHVLRTDGILKYDMAVSNKVQNSVILPHGSAEEIEIRGCAARCVEMIAEEAGMRAMDVDHRLWHRSELAHYKALPTHKTESIFY